ncbi:MAG: helix-turn-helix transcriptional regulator [Bacilli bacterium]|jgi:transcriptional regulator with XRE-family HTH domain|nr:helix-turn-helix transcriptional regulator [Bacilli bacterium]
MTSNHEVGQFIQRKRKELSITQKDLADKLSLSPQAISKWETGETLPDTGMLLTLADVLETTVDKILSGGVFVLRKNKTINVNNILEGLKALDNLRNFFGEKSTFYRGAIEGINQKMNIDFEKYMKDESSKEVLITEIIIQYLMDGYTITKEEVNSVVQSAKMRNLIYKYIGEEATIDKLFYQDNPQLFDQIRSLEPEFMKINSLNKLPGEYLHLDQGKDYWANQIETTRGFCFGIAVGDGKIRVFTYGFGGENMKLIHEINIL